MSTYFFIFILGATIGSFLNVVVLRFNTGKSFASGRSACFSCGKPIYWYENIPIVSFVFLRGRCSGCKTRISIQYPLVEASTALVFLLGFIKFEYLLPTFLQSFIISFLLFILISCFLILTFVYDLKHKIIPNEFIYPFILLAGLTMFFPEGYFVVPDLLHVLSGPLLFLPFFILWFISSGRWIGFADGKLAWGIGWLLGLVYGISAITLGFWIGALFVLGIFAMLKLGLSDSGSGLTIRSEVPFGPFLIIALAIAYFIPLDFFRLAYFLS